MFDLTAGHIDRPFRDPHAAAAVVSLGTHVIIVGAVVATVFLSVSSSMPEVPTIMAFVAEAPAPAPPPPPPPPPAAKAAAPARPQPAPATGPTFTAPAEITLGIHQETGIDLGTEDGVVGGVEGGIPGGVLGGVPGGIVTDVMPPPPPKPPVVPRRVGGELKAPALLKRVEPEYPGLAVSARVSGTVILEATVDEAGAVADVKVLRSIPLLDKAAVTAVRQWRYESLRLNDQPTPFILVVTLTFTLRER